DGVDRARMLLGERGEEAAVVHELEVSLGDVEARLRERHLEVLDERAEEGPLAVEAPQLARLRGGERGPAPVPGGQEAPVLRPREDPRDRAERREVVVALRPPSRTRADLEQGELVDGRELAEELDEAVAFPHERPVGPVGVPGKLREELAR